MNMVQINCRIEQELTDQLDQAATASQLNTKILVKQAIEQFLAAASSKAIRSLASETSVIVVGPAVLAKRVGALEAAAKGTQAVTAVIAPSPEHGKVDGLFAELMAKLAPSVST